MTFKKIIIAADDNNQSEQYQDDKGNIYNVINENDFNCILEKLKFNDDYSLPDRIVRDYIRDGTIIPSFKKSIYFNKYDMEDLVKDLNPYKKTKNCPKRNTKKKTDKNK